MRLIVFLGVFCFVIKITFGIAAAQSLGESEQIGSWSYKSIVDRMNGKKRFVAGSGTKTEQIAIKCDFLGKDTIYVGIYTNRFIGLADEKRPVEFKVDDKAASSQTWEYDKNSGNQFDKGKAREFLNYLKGGKNLLFRVMKSDYSTFDVDVDLSGVDEVIDRISRDCAG